MKKNITLNNTKENELDCLIQDDQLINIIGAKYNDKIDFFRTLFNMVPGGVSIATDISCEKIIHNPIAAKFLRIKPWESMSHSLTKEPQVKVFLNETELSPDKMPVQRSAWFGEEVIGEELDFIWEDGVSKTAILSSKPIYDENGDMCCVILTWEDITARKKLQDEIQKYQSKLKELVREQVDKLHQQSKLIEHANDAIIVEDLNWKITYWNKGAEEIYGWESHEVIGKDCYNLLNTVTSIPIEVIHEYLQKNGKWNGELIQINKNGKQIIVSSRKVLYRDVYGEPEAILTINRNETIQKRVEQALRQSENQFTKIFYNLPICASINEMPGGEYIDVNDAFLNFFGFKRSEVIERNALDLGIVDKDVIENLKLLYEQNILVKDKEIFAYRKSGEKRTVLITVQSIYISSKPYSLALINDITDKKNRENEMFRLSQLNLIGELSASIGHEIRNPMTTVRGFLQLLGNKPQYHEDKEFFELMISELDRANGIITEFLSLSINKTVKLKLCCLNRLIENISPLISSDALKSDKEIKMELGDLPKILLDEKEIRQLILNLVKNGLESMNTRGTLYISTHVTNGDVILQVRDEGAGIPQEIIDKLGQPFVTTKENGTGLGLSVCYSICQRHKAKMDFKTNSDGTTFCVSICCKIKVPKVAS